MESKIKPTAEHSSLFLFEPSRNKMSEATDPSGTSSSSNLDYWYNLYSAKDSKPEGVHQAASGSNLEADWGYVFDDLRKGKETRRRKRDYGHGSLVNSASDLSEALSSISAALSLSSSSDSDRQDDHSDGNGEAEKGEEDEDMVACVASNPSVTEESDADDILTSFSDGYFPDSSALEKIQVPVPRIAMEFSAEEEAYRFYRSYAQASGFTVRKGKVQRSADGAIRKRYFFCSRQGFRSITQLAKRTNRTGKSKLKSKSSCRYIGVRQRTSGKWVAEMKEQAKSGGFRTWLGTYDTAEEAAMAYDRAAAESQCYVGKVQLNFPDRQHLLERS
ncbi:Ethylene-responsive transcription factor ERF112, partial [Linum grandiflorum]